MPNEFKGAIKKGRNEEITLKTKIKVKNVAENITKE